MMKKIFYCIAIFIFIYNISFSQNKNIQQLSKILSRQIALQHYSPKPLDDKFSANLFDKFIEEFDNGNYYILQSDYEKLLPYKFSVDKEINGSKAWKFLDVAKDVMIKSILRVDSILLQRINDEVDYKVKDSLNYNFDKENERCKTYADLKKRWYRISKYQVLSSAYSAEEFSSGKISSDSVLRKYEKLLKEKFKVKHKNILQKLDTSLSNSYSKKIDELFLNTIAKIFDPHTNYFSFQEKENFQSELSTQNFMFGFDIDKAKDGRIYIKRIVPGSPAWKSGELHKNDEILKLQWEGKPEQDLAMMDADDVEEILDQNNHGTILITIKRNDGTIAELKLQKEKIENEEENVKSFILNGNKKIGFIRLPDFYTTWDGESGSGCANDLAKEIIKLRDEKIEALILDLRFNGGGSLQEALELVGIFIDEGPLMGLKRRDKNPSFLKDPNRGTVYDAPLVLLVNKASASASEIAAATLQDYHRAVIVGGNTYGKSTMQSIFPMDTLNENATNNFGFAKITNGKIYRLTGKTAQLTGVKPDIELPDLFDGLEIGEQFSDYALPADSIPPNKYFQPLTNLPIEQLQQKCRIRIDTINEFKKIRLKINQRKQNLAKDIFVPLNWDEYKNWAKKNVLDIDETDFDRIVTCYKVSNNKREELNLKLNNFSQELNQEQIDNIQKDIYIEQAYFVAEDLINLLGEIK